MGNPFVHLDLAADDVEGAKQFYGKIFDWKFQDFPEMKWTGIGVGKGVGGGMGPKNMPGQPTAWTAYVEVADVSSTMAKARDAGATVYVERQEIPGMGVLGVFADPQGAVIGVWEPVKKPAAPRSAARGASKRSAAKKTAQKAAKPAARKAPAKAAAKKAAPKKKAGKKK